MHIKHPFEVRDDHEACNLLRKSEGEEMLSQKHWILKLKKNANILKEIEDDGRIYPNEFDDEIGKLENFETLMADVLVHPMLTKCNYFLF
jgi:hypothetical protein